MSKLLLTKKGVPYDFETSGISQLATQLLTFFKYLHTSHCLKPDRIKNGIIISY